MLTIVICNVVKDTFNLQRLIEIFVSKDFVNKIIVIGSETNLSTIATNNNVEFKYVSYEEGVNKSIFEICSASDSDYLAILFDCFLFSPKFSDYIYNELQKNPMDLFVLGKDDEMIVSSFEELSDDNYQIYKEYDLVPSDNDFESCLFLSKSFWNKYLNSSDNVFSLKSHYYLRYLASKCLKAGIKIEYPVNVRILFNNNYLEHFDLEKKQDKNLAKELGVVPKLHLNYFEKIFSLVQFNKHTVLTILGLSIPFKIRKKPKFDSECKEYTYFSERKRFDTKKACIFAGFTSNGEISENSLHYLSSLKKHVDYLVYVADSKAKDNTFKSLEKICDAVIVKRHEEYDFGSYKLGFKLLCENSVLDSIDYLLICNDSVDFVGSNQDLSQLFAKAKDFDAYSLCMATYGFGNKIKRHKYEWIKNPHVQSYFLITSKKLFSDNGFKDFIFSVKKLHNKTEIIKQYEMGLSEFLRKNNFSMGSYYPYDDTNIVNPYAIYLNSYIEKPILIKHMLLKDKN